MDVLVTCINFPYPLENGENLRIYHYTRALREKHDFDLVCLGSEPVPEPLTALFRNIQPIKADRRLHFDSSLHRLAASFSIDQFCPRIPELQRGLQQALAARRYDVIWSSAEVLPSLPADCNVPVLGDIVDDMVVQSKRLLKTRRRPGQYIKTLKRLLLARGFEKRYFSKADACLYVSEVDAEYFSRLCPATSVEVIHNGVDAEFFSPAPDPVEEDYLVFEGNMGFYPNSDGAQHFCNEILPLILERRPNVKLYLVGKEPSKRVLALASPHVVVTGFVDDVRPYLRKATVFVSPTRTGTGIKNKILQAWSMGKAVVASPASTGGLLFEDGRNILVRATPQAFAAAVVELLEDSEQRRRLGEAARRTIVDRYTWAAKASELELLLHRLAGRPAS